MTIVCIILVAASFIMGLAASAFFAPKNMGVLHIDKTGEKDKYMFEIYDLDGIETKSTINLKIVVKQ